jgi:threonine/homoserine/homoserine lactone efflux protein
MFVIAMTGSPGPANITMMAIGQSTGFLSTIPFLLGSVVGFALLNTCVGLGVGELISTSPQVALVMKIVGTAYILYLATKIMIMQLVSARTVERRFTFVEGLMLQPSSPKSWAMSVVGITQFAIPDSSLAARLTLFVGFLFLGQFTAHCLWGGVGATLLHFLKNDFIRVGINASAAIFMVVATGYALFF